MAHQIEKSDGIFSVAVTPWHKLGITIKEAPSIADGIKLAGLDWRVIERPIHVDGVLVNSHKAILRATDMSQLGVVGKGWKPLQNDETFKFFDPFISSGAASLETAGSLQSGKRVWVLAKLNRDPIEIARDDYIAKYLLLSNSHDGSLAVRVGFTPIRVVCANTLAMAFRSEMSSLLRIRHTANLMDTLKQVQEITNTANAEFEATAEQYRLLASRDINTADLKKYVREVFKMVDVDGSTTTRADNILDSIIGRFEAGIGVTAANRGTYWTAYNAITEHLSYGRSRNPESTLNALWFGEGAKLNKRALDVALAASVA